MSEKRVAKCSRKAFCTSLDERLNPYANDRAKGFSTVEILNFTTGHTRTIGVVFRKSRYDKGLMLNVCPFCTRSLRWWGKRA